MLNLTDFSRISELSQNHANCVVLLVATDKERFAKDFYRLQLAFVVKPLVQIHAFKEITNAVQFLVRYLRTPAWPQPLSKADETTLLVKKACQNLLNVYVSQNGL